MLENIGDNWLTLFDHFHAYKWYTETAKTNGPDGFYYSPWGGHPFPAPPSPPGGGPQPGPDPEIEEPIGGFQFYGDVVWTNEAYQLTEVLDAGIFKTLQMPIGAEALRFSYRFLNAGDGDFLGVHWGSNVVLYVGPDVQLTRDQYLDAEVPVEDFGGTTNTLQFRLVSRGTTNAVLAISNIRFLINPDIDGDGLENGLEQSLGTDPHRYDSDGDGLGDGDEVNIFHTNPLSADTDGDGIPDGQEVAAGTDPANAASVLKIVDVQRSPDGSVTIQWQSATNKLYRVHRSVNLSRGNYLTLTNAMPSTAPVNSYTDFKATNATAFYWIEAQ